MSKREWIILSVYIYIVLSVVIPAFMIHREYRKHKRIMSLLNDADKATRAMSNARNPSELMAHKERFDEIMELADKLRK